MNTESVKELQDILVNLGYMTQAEVNTGYGIYGPKTTAAMAQFNKDGSEPKKHVPETNEKTQKQIDDEYKTAVSNNPVITELAKGGSTIDEIINGLQTGDISGLTTMTGQPFSAQDQQDALARGMDDNKLYYEAQQKNDAVATENALAQKQGDYQDWLILQGDKFQADKTTLDQNAADTGMLFSSGRSQKEQKLQNSYGQAQSSKLATLGRDVGTTANDFQYKYGNNAASGLSQYYNAGGNTYNANVATGGVGSSGLSSIYNPSNSNYQGTANTERSAAAQKRAAGYLWNKGNKLMSTGHNNQY